MRPLRGQLICPQQCILLHGICRNPSQFIQSLSSASFIDKCKEIIHQLRLSDIHISRRIIPIPVGRSLTPLCGIAVALTNTGLNTRGQSIAIRVSAASRSAGSLRLGIRIRARVGFRSSSWIGSVGTSTAKVLIQLSHNHGSLGPGHILPTGEGSFVIHTVDDSSRFGSCDCLCVRREVVGNIGCFHSRSLYLRAGRHIAAGRRHRVVDNQRHLHAAARSVDLAGVRGRLLDIGPVQQSHLSRHTGVGRVPGRAGAGIGGKVVTEERLHHHHAHLRVRHMVVGQKIPMSVAGNPALFRGGLDIGAAPVPGGHVGKGLPGRQRGEAQPKAQRQGQKGGNRFFHIRSLPLCKNGNIIAQFPGEGNRRDDVTPFCGPRIRRSRSDWLNPGKLGHDGKKTLMLR